MKRLLYLALGLSATRPTAAQSCTGVTITSQADADSAFNDCNDISGSVTISPDAQGTLNLDGLESVSENLVIEDTGLVGITIPDIEIVGGSVSVTGNEQLNRLGLESVAGINGDLTVQGNDALVDLRMNDLESVRGGIHLDGGFNTLSFENLERVQGDSDIVATGSAGCSGLDALNTGGSSSDEDNGSGSVFQGSYTCATTSASPSPTTTSTSDPTSTSSPTTSPTGTDAPDDGSDSGLSGGAIAGVVVGIVVGVVIILILIWLFLRERRKSRNNAAAALGTGAATGGGAALAAAAMGNRRDEEKEPSEATSPRSTAPAPGVAAGGGIPRRPVSTATGTTALTPSSPTSTDPYSNSTLPSSLTAGSTNASSMPVPTALIPGTNNRNTDGIQNDALFFGGATPMGARPPRHRRPSESDVPMLDSGNVHEVSGVSRVKDQRTGERVVSQGEVFELDGGFEGARHQRAIHREGGGGGDDVGDANGGEDRDGDGVVIDREVEPEPGPLETGIVTRNTTVSRMGE
ncbi:putative GPI-anchored cell wall protein Pst1 [Aspergillus undulatus]|uniref:putative GPI-anchored cell wall protein Pst1 n=1 Tax=Aspergillus undulatus TaxID=1810928 RepID=UPI003CCE3E31